METRKEIAAEKKRCGSHNCTQAVLCTYHDFTGMEEETIKNAGNAFAAGMGNMEDEHKKERERLKGYIENNCELIVE